MDGDSRVLLALVAAAVSWWLVRSWLIAQMSNVALASAAKEYLVKSSVTVTAKSDTYLYTDVKRTPRRNK